MLVSLAILPLLLVPALTVPTGDNWEPWGPYGECSRTCGSGVTMRTRRCITQRTDGGHNCVGPNKSYSSCNVQDCPEGSRDFREEQCSQFDGTDFQGKRYKWLPYYGAENPCELNCMPRGENFFYRHRSSVADGTPCHPGRRDVCVGGVCKRLGCDLLLESTQQEDACLQCGGSGQSCRRVQNTFSVQSLPNGYNQMFIIPVGATSIRITETTPTRNYFAIKNLRGEYYLNGHWVIEFSRSTPVAGTVLYYQRGPEGGNTPETIIGRGPTTEPLVIEMISQEPNQGVDFEYYLPNGRSRQGYFWSYGSWAACSKECGSGFQSRLVFCAIDNEVFPDYLCASLPRPSSNRTCNAQACPLTNSWTMGEWNTCSVTCGGGSQLRSVQCVSHDASGPRVVEDAVCAAFSKAPPTLQTCNMQRCAEYSVSSWSQCSVSCGAGDQTREVTCVGSGGMRLEEAACSALPRPLATQACQMAPCPRRAIGWHVGDWGLCSRSCGGGLRDRRVMCADADRNLYPVEQCSAQPQPAAAESCKSQACRRPQLVPSVQDPTGHDHTQTGFTPYVPDVPTTGHGSATGTVHDPHSSAPAIHCSQSQYGCCPDGRVAAGGPRGLGCPRVQELPVAPPTDAQQYCTGTSYGCCRDGVTPAQGPSREGCQEHAAAAPTAAVAASLPTTNALQCRTTVFGCCYDRATPAGGPNGEECPAHHLERTVCTLPKAAGSCADWTARFHYDVIAGKCVHFWYGNCHGNNNNFLTRAECQQACPSGPASAQWTPGPAPIGPASRGPASRPPAGGATSVSTSTAVGGGGATPGVGRDMGGVFTAPGGAGVTRQGGNAASHAHRARLHLRPRRPTFGTAAQSAGPAASLTLGGGVTIDPSDPSRVEALVGQTAVLPCRVSPPPSSTLIVEWRRDGEPLSTRRHHQQPNGSLLVGPLSMADAGWYLCVATQDRERDHRYIYLSVSEGSQPIPTDPLPGDGPSPRFSIQSSAPSVMELRSGQTATLPCHILPASALSSVTIHWTREGHTLTESRITQNSEGTLTIGQLRSGDSGVYTCTASNQKQLEQRQLQLRVKADLRITTAPTNVHVTQGDTAVLPCVVSGDNVNVGWSRNGVPVRADGVKVRASADGSLVVSDAQPADEGTYTCNAYTGIYSVSAAAEVKVTRRSQQVDLPPDCVDQPDLANCELIVYARLCSNSYYSSFCCGSCTRHARSTRRAQPRG
ncbi:papilin [Gadus morhua]|uniref:papilin n=1 Tax=Gadus morhua TaxID=8049 RepID=UPI0011B45A71|nr:papilin [Gadus morhua]